jgi:hypothetical protein
MVTSACAAASLLLQPFEERTNDIDVQDRVVELVSSASFSLRGMTEEESEGITVGQYGVTTGIAFYGQVLFEEVLDELLERDDCGLVGVHESTSSSALV